MRVQVVLLGLLAGVAASSGASIELSFDPNTTGSIDQVEFDGATIPRVTLRGSDLAYIDIVLMDAAEGFAFWYLGTSTEGETADLFTFEEVIPGPNMQETPSQPAPGDLLNDWKGVNYVYPYVTEAGDFLLVTLVVHCTDAAGETLVMLDDLNGEAFVTRADQSDYDIDFAAPMVLIRQLASEGGGGGTPADDGTGDDDDGETDTGDENDPADSGTDDTDDDGLPDAEDPDDDDDGVPDAEDAEPLNPDGGDSTDGNGGSSGGGTSGGGGRSAGAPCGAGMITTLPIGVLGWCGLAVWRRSHRPR